MTYLSCYGPLEIVCILLLLLLLLLLLSLSHCGVSANLEP